MSHASKNSSSIWTASRSGCRAGSANRSNGCGSRRRAGCAFPSGFCCSRRYRWISADPWLLDGSARTDRPGEGRARRCNLSWCGSWTGSSANGRPNPVSLPVKLTPDWRRIPAQCHRQLAEPKPVPRLYLITPPVKDAAAFARALQAALAAADIAAVLSAACAGRRIGIGRPHQAARAPRATRRALRLCSTAISISSAAPAPMGRISPASLLVQDAIARLKPAALRRGRPDDASRRHARRRSRTPITFFSASLI